MRLPCLPMFSYDGPLTRIVCLNCGRLFDNTHNGMVRYERHADLADHTDGYTIVDIDRLSELDL